MPRTLWFVIAAGLVFTGCHTAKKVAVTSFRVMDAPASYIRHKIDSGDETTTTTTTTTDVSNPGYPVEPPVTPPPVTRRQTTATTAHAPTATTTARPQATVRKTTPSATPRAAASQPAQFPVARPVPGRPGYVYSLDSNGGMIDVTGYKAGDKAKDPYTKQIFIVP
ncbi:MAG: hypothetical protein M3032_07965 [Verrucomicrobiota bacterium]|nr:hypothetical protein [Verrucomicrobiota bacterium]